MVLFFLLCVCRWLLCCPSCVLFVLAFVCSRYVQRAIQSGVDNLDSGIGVYAGDEESYEVFAPLFDRVIEDYHSHPPV